MREASDPIELLQEVSTYVFLESSLTGNVKNEVAARTEGC